MDDLRNADSLCRRLQEGGWNLAAVFSDDSRNCVDYALLSMANANGQTVSDNCWLNDWTALHWASHFGRVDCVLRVLSVRPELVYSRTVSYGLTPLHCAIRNGSPNVVEALLVSGINPNVQDNFGDTAAHYAARDGRLELIRHLLSAGCDLSKVNMAGLTATDISEMEGHNVCTRYLQQAGRLQCNDLFPPYCCSNASTAQPTTVDHNQQQQQKVALHSAVDVAMDIDQGGGQQLPAAADTHCVAGAYGFIPLCGGHNDLLLTTLPAVVNGYTNAPVLFKPVKRPSTDSLDSSAEYAFKRSKLLG